MVGRVVKRGIGVVSAAARGSGSLPVARWSVSRRLCAVSLVVVGFWVIVFVAPSDALASGVGGWAPAVEAILPPNAGTGTDVGSVSCASPGGCSAVGWYGDKSSDIQGLLVGESSGRWGTGVEAMMPANASSDPSPSFRSVSCTSVGSCTAIGSYSDSSAHEQGLLLSERSGVWAQGVEAVLPANAAGDPNVALSSVSCSSPGDCTAVGTYVDSSNSPEGLLLSEHSGVWSRGVEAVLPANAATGGTGLSDHDLCDTRSPCVDITSVSCAAAGECAAVGSYNASSVSGQGLLLSESSGVWTRGVQAVLPAPTASDAGAGLSSVSCSSPGACTAVGSYDFGTGNSQGLLVSENSGKWASGVQATLSVAAGAVGNTEINSVSCASPGNCAAGGSYRNGANSQEGLLLSESEGRWAPGVGVPLPPNAINNPVLNVASIDSVSCVSAGNCAAVGSYLTSNRFGQGLLSSAEQGLLLSESSGRWSQGVEADLPANASTSPFQVAALSSVSCTPTGSCAAVGNYIGSGSPEGLLVTGTLALPPHSTTITRARINGRRRTASFTFTAANATRFQCALIKHRPRRRHKTSKVIFRSCSAQRAYRHLKHGRYTFEVRGVNSTGTVDPAPAIKNFAI